MNLLSSKEIKMSKGQDRLSERRSVMPTYGNKDTLLLKLHAQGLEPSVIAQRVGMSASGVRVALKRLMPPSPKT